MLSSAEYLKTAFADDTYGKNVTEKTSSIAEAHNAVLAINGDYYGAQERGYVIRNGVVYRDTKGSNDVLCIYADGTMQVISPDEYSAEELVSMGVWQAFSFGPGLIEDGTITVTQNQEVGKAMASNPRTAVGIIDSNHYVFVVSDGRTSESEGLSLYQLAEFMQDKGFVDMIVDRKKMRSTLAHLLEHTVPVSLQPVHLVCKLSFHCSPVPVIHMHQP